MFNKNKDLLILKNTNAKNKEKIRKKFFFSSPFLIILICRSQDLILQTL